MNLRHKGNSGRKKGNRLKRNTSGSEAGENAILKQQIEKNI